MIESKIACSSLVAQNFTKLPQFFVFVLFAKMQYLMLFLARFFLVKIWTYTSIEQTNFPPSTNKVHG